MYSKASKNDTELENEVFDTLQEVMAFLQKSISSKQDDLTIYIPDEKIWESHKIGDDIKI